MPQATFDFSKVIATVNGVPLSGWGDGDAIKIEHEGERWTHQVGVDGTVTRMRSVRSDGKITFILQASSSLNKVLQTFAALDDLSSYAPVTIVILDTLLGNRWTATGCSLQMPPNATMGREVAPYEWVYLCAQIDQQLGGGVPF